MLIPFKETNGTVNVIADGSLRDNPTVYGSENESVSFVLRCGGHMEAGNVWRPLLIRCYVTDFNLVGIAKQLKKDDTVFILGTRTKDTSQHNGIQHRVYCSTLIPTKSLSKYMSWVEQSMQMEKQIYKDVIGKNRTTYDGNPDEKLDVDF